MLSHEFQTKPADFIYCKYFALNKSLRPMMGALVFLTSAWESEASPVRARRSVDVHLAHGVFQTQFSFPRVWGKICSSR